MPTQLQSLRIQNFRCLHDVTVPTRGINVLFGPNGIGKTSFLDALWFVRDCALRGTDQAASDRHHGIGVLWDGAAPEDRIIITLETTTGEYTVSFGYSSGRIEPFVGERFRSKIRPETLVERAIGSDTAGYFHEQLRHVVQLKMREPEKLAFSNYLLLCEPSRETLELDEVLRSVRFYSSRAVDLSRLRKLGSESNQQTFLFDRWQNLWSALRNLHDRRVLDDRYDTILGFLRQAFPGSFKDLLFEQIGADRVTASFLESNRRRPIPASGVSDGHLQFLGLLLALFGDSPGRYNLALFDEPEISLHPHAVHVFAEAVKLAATKFGRQVFLATHSPVLISQFAEADVLVFAAGVERETRVAALSDLPQHRDLLDQYPLGSLYMAEEIGRQSLVP